MINKDSLPIVLALIVSLGFLALLGMMAFHEIPPTSHDLLLIMIGSLASAFAGIIAYYFGSSSGSAKKTEMLGNQNDKTTTVISGADSVVNTTEKKP